MVNMKAGIAGVVATLVLSILTAILTPLGIQFLFDANSSYTFIQNSTIAQTILNSTPVFAILTPFFVVLGGMVVTAMLFFKNA